jgi:hypothetical protein
MNVLKKPFASWTILVAMMIVLSCVLKIFLLSVELVLSSLQLMGYLHFCDAHVSDHPLGAILNNSAVALYSQKDVSAPFAWELG